MVCFSDSYSHVGEICDDSDADDGNRPLSLLEVTQKCARDSEQPHLPDLFKINKLYQTLALPNSKLQIDNTHLQPSSLLEILANSHDSLIDGERGEVDYESIPSDVMSHALISSYARNVQQNACSRLPSDNFPCSIATCMDSKVVAKDNICDMRSDVECRTTAMRECQQVPDKCCSSVSSVRADEAAVGVCGSKAGNTPLGAPNFSEDVLLSSPHDCSLSEVHISSGLVSRDDSQCGNLDDDDSVGNRSDESDSDIKSSKFSKFLCVGVGRTKTKTPYKISKGNFKNESKKNSKMKESKSKLYSVKIDSSKSLEFSSKNVLKSPSEIPLVSMSYSNDNSGCDNASESPNCLSDSSFAISRGKGTESAQGSSCDIVELEAVKESLCNTNSYNTSCSLSYETRSTEPCLFGDHSGGGGMSAHTKPSEDNWSSAKTSHVKKIHSSMPAKSGTSSSIATTTISLGESSGYGSMARDSECSSFSSSQDSEMDEEHKREKPKSGSLHFHSASRHLPPLRLQKFTQEDIQRYENRSRQALQQRLKEENLHPRQVTL